MTPDQITMLQAKLDPSAVKSRSQSGRSLSYIEGWHAIAEANRIFGFDAWNRETVDIRCVAERERKIGQAQRDGWSVSYVIRVRVTVGEIVREGVGAGHGIDADLGLAHESAIKEAETDAMKRALMTFGNPFGLALYDKTMANVGIDDDGPTESEKRIAASLKTAIDMAKTWPDLNVWKNAPENVKLFQQLPDDLRKDVTDHAAKRKEALAPTTEQKAA